MIRVIYLATGNYLSPIKEIPISLDQSVWSGGKYNVVKSLHDAARNSMIDKEKYNILEVSTAGESFGRSLSALNLMAKIKIDTLVGKKEMSFSVESLYQGSKVFEDRLSHQDMYNLSGLEAKKDSKKFKGTTLKKFRLFNKEWDLEPKFAFYSWLYMKSLDRYLSSNDLIMEEFLKQDSFTDIYANPDTNSQAFACAMYRTLSLCGKTNILHSRKSYIAYCIAIDYKESIGKYMGAGYEVIQTSENSFIEIHRGIICKPKADMLYRYYNEYTKWVQETYTFGGISKPSPRLVCFMGDLPYKYSGIVHDKCQMDDVTIEIMRNIPSILNNHNSCVLNMYRDGNDSISMHTDDEKEIDLNAPIVSVSLGETRTFVISSSTGTNKVKLNNGDIAIMRGKFQEECKHGIMKEPLINKSRINLTFRRLKQL